MERSEHLLGAPARRSLFRYPCSETVCIRTLQEWKWNDRSTCSEHLQCPQKKQVKAMRRVEHQRAQAPKKQVQAMRRVEH
jgi:hypothetical protein